MGVEGDEHLVPLLQRHILPTMLRGDVVLVGFRILKLAQLFALDKQLVGGLAIGFRQGGNDDIISARRSGEHYLARRELVFVLRRINRQGLIIAILVGRNIRDLSRNREIADRTQFQDAAGRSGSQHPNQSNLSPDESYCVEAARNDLFVQICVHCGFCSWVWVVHRTHPSACVFALEGGFEPVASLRWLCRWPRHLESGA